MKTDDHYKDGVTGSAQIDAQHRVMHALVQAALKPADGTRVETSLETRLHALAEFARTHFAAEEDEMRRLGYPEASEHGQAHVHALSELAEFADRANREGSDAQAEIGPRLRNWFSFHMAGSDLDFSRWMRSTALAGASSAPGPGGSKQPEP